MAIFTAIIAFTGFVVGTGTILGLSAGLSAALIGIGKAILWSVASAVFGPKPPKASPQEVQAMLAQATGPRIRGYGEFLLAGTRALWEAQDGKLYQIIATHHGDVSEIVGWYVDGELVTFDVDGEATTGSAVGYLNVQSILSGDGGDYPDVRAALPTIWTEDHKLTGLATYSVIMTAPAIDQMSNKFPRSDQTSVQMAAKLSEVMDPRTMVVGYTDLTGPCVLDYLTHPDGYRIPLPAIDLDSFDQFTNLCDQDVDLKDGGTEKRYRVGGYYTLEDQPKEVTARLLATADAQIYMTPEGKVAILGGEWLEPDVTITPLDILSFEMSDGVDVFTDFNVLKGIFMSPAHRYQQTDAQEMRDDTALLTQPERVDTFGVDMCPAFGQMRRLMKCHWNARHRDWTGTIKTNLVGMKARFPRGQGKHVIRLVIEDLGIDQAFEVLGHSYSVADRTCDITVASIENPYPWDAETEEGDPPPPLADLVMTNAYVDPPTGLTLGQEVVGLGEGLNAVRLTATVDDPERDDLQLTAEYREISDFLWRPMIVGVGDLRAHSETVQDRQTYNVRARWQGYTDYSISEEISVMSNPVAPDTVTALTSSEAGGTITLSWINGGSGYYRTRIYRSDSATFGSAAVWVTLAGLAGTEQTYDDMPGTGTWYYWAVTINPSLIEATPTGPVSETI
ncbi:hypothetical protein [Oceaniovalibus sp. ACAM 378]|uniref:hypothetical protein n=1 Tax=Oceaniovalibus sp. ACAM 378 TaxID=2599923 RepID=UPI0011D5E8F2|nr:hypothetical protein [Oceaniovalibus sp. ACAM 378]TYB83934.1 hypothetical protein FQ320_23545 [Oceaniovalibus sp. ACAM 378]